MARDISVYVSNNTPRRIQTMHAYDSIGNRQKVVRGYAYDANGDLRQVFPGFIEKTYTHATGLNTALPASTLLRVLTFDILVYTISTHVGFDYQFNPGNISPSPPNIGSAQVRSITDFFVAGFDSSFSFVAYYPIAPPSWPTVNSLFHYLQLNGNTLRTSDANFNSFALNTTARTATWSWSPLDVGLVAGNTYPFRVAVSA